MDQAQHFTGTASAAARSGGDEVGAEFRSGLDAAERECECLLPFCSIALLFSIMMVTGCVLSFLRISYGFFTWRWRLRYTSYNALGRPGLNLVGPICLRGLCGMWDGTELKLLDDMTTMDSIAGVGIQCS